MLFAIIMAGGAGTRFWPLSRSRTPKQLLDLVGGQTMIQATVNRLGSLIPPERVFIITNAILVDAIREQLPHLPPQNIVGEPCKRDTAPCIGLAAQLVLKQDPDATMVVMPSDHLIQPDLAFQNALAGAAEMVDANPGRIVTFGIKPSYPAEVFGYIERGDSVSATGLGILAFQAKQFREKPVRAVAEQYMEAGTFYWNSGIFVWKAQTIAKALAQHAPEMSQHLVTIGQHLGSPDYLEVLQREFSAIVGKSIDYAVMEKHPDIAVIEAPFQWDDVGSWQALSRSLGTDADGNTLVGKTIAIRTKDCIVRSAGEHLIATIGMQDCIVVHTPDATLVAHKREEESIREIVKALQDRGETWLL